MEKKAEYFKLLFFICIFLTSCNQNILAQPTESITINETLIIQITDPTLEPFTFPTSNPNLATISGRLIVLNLSMLPANDDAIFLVPLNPIDEISTIPIFEPEEVPQAIVDERTGDFVFNNIQVGKYVLVVLTQSGAQIPASFPDNGSYVIFDIHENNLDEIYNLGDINFP